MGLSKSIPVPNKKQHGCGLLPERADNPPGDKAAHHHRCPTLPAIRESREKLHQLIDLDEKGRGCCSPPTWLYEFVDSKCKLIHLTFAQWFVLTLAKRGNQDPMWERAQPPLPGGEESQLGLTQVVNAPKQQSSSGTLGSSIHCCLHNRVMSPLEQINPTQNTCV